MIETFKSFGAFGLGLIFGGLVLLILLLLGILRKAPHSKRWAGFGLVGLGACLSLNGILSATTMGIRLFGELRPQDSGGPEVLKNEFDRIDQLFLGYQALALIGVIAGALILVYTHRPKEK